MNSAEFDALLLATLEDGRLSRGERTSVRAAIEDLEVEGFALLRNRVFELARAQLGQRDAEEVLAWCEDVVKLAGACEASKLGGVRGVKQEVWFSPADSCARRIVEAIDGARTSIDVCVFTITDDRITAALAGAHRRRSVPVRLITDDEKSVERGSDIDTLERLGIAVRMDRSTNHMHHKFAVFDGRLALTGSYNWTRSAANYNQENFLLSDDPALVREYGREFDRLWRTYAHGV